MVKIFRKDLFVTALIFSLILFSGGFLLGYIWDSYRLDYSDSLVGIGTLDTESFLLEQDFVESFNATTSVENRLLDINRRIGKVGEMLVQFDAKKMSHGEEYDSLKRKYFLLELKAYTLRHKQGGNNNIILFFYDVTQNDDSLRMGDVLNALVRADPNVVVFSIDREFTGEPMLDTVKQYYNVTKSPTIIINYDQKYEGFVDLAEVKKNLK